MRDYTIDRWRNPRSGWEILRRLRGLRMTEREKKVMSVPIHVNSQSCHPEAGEARWGIPQAADGSDERSRIRTRIHASIMTLSGTTILAASLHELA